MGVRPLLLTVCATALLAACASDGGLSHRAEPRDPSRLASADTLAAVDDHGLWPRTHWWSRFGDPQLDALVDEALTGSPSLAMARARLDRAIAGAGLADANRGPRVDANGEDSYQRFTENGRYPPPYAGAWGHVARLSLDFSYELDFWGRNARRFEAAVGRVRAAEAEQQQARLMLATAVVGSYLELERSYAQRDIAEALVAQRQRMLDLTRDRVGAGLDAQVALRQAEAAIPDAQAQVAAMDEQMQLLRNRIAALLGQGPDRGLRIARPTTTANDPLALPTSVPAALIGRRPDVVAERWRVEAAARDIDAARADFYPNINLAAFVGLEAIGLDRLFEGGSRVAGAGPALTLPLFDAGRLRQQLSARNADYDAAAEAYNATVIDAVRDVADQIARWQGVDRQLARSREALARFEDAYRLALLRYREGLTNYLTVLTVEGQVLAQRRQVADLDAERRHNAVGLVRALGGGFDPERPADPQDPTS